MLYKKCNYI